MIRVALQISAACAGVACCLSRSDIATRTSGNSFGDTRATGASGRTGKPASRIDSTGCSHNRITLYRNVS